MAIRVGNHAPSLDGSEKRNVDPAPGADRSTQMRPPYCSITRRQMASPKPLPGYWSRLCRRLNNPKICS